MYQLQQYEELDLVNAQYERRMMVKKSGCKAPCRYKVGFSPRMFDNSTGLLFPPRSTKLRQRTGLDQLDQVLEGNTETGPAVSTV